MNELSPIGLFPTLEEMVADRVRYDELIFLDKAALAALSGIRDSTSLRRQANEMELSNSDIAKNCYAMANAMLEERRRLHLNQQKKKENP